MIFHVIYLQGWGEIEVVWKKEIVNENQLNTDLMKKININWYSWRNELILIIIIIIIKSFDDGRIVESPKFILKLDTYIHILYI